MLEEIGNTNARIQAGVACAVLITAVCVLTLLDQPWWIAVGLAILVGQVGFLTMLLQFVLMSANQGTDPTPRPSPWTWLKACVGEHGVCQQVFAFDQPFRYPSAPNLLPLATRNERGVLLLHGFFCNRGLWLDWVKSFQAQGVPVLAISLQPAFGSIDAYIAQVEAAVAELERATGLPPVLVGHSMGGLVARAWLAQTQPERAHHVLTLGTPHHGTWLAGLSHAKNGKQMRIGSLWLAQLAQAELAQRGARAYANFTCVYSNCDNIVYPTQNAVLAGATAVQLPGVGHVALAKEMQSIQLVHKLRAD